MWRNLCVGIAVTIAWAATAGAEVSTGPGTPVATAYSGGRNGASEGDYATTAAGQKASQAGTLVLTPPKSASVSLQVKHRLLDSLTDEMRNNFGLFIYVSKADHGPWAQRMYVYQKTEAGDLYQLYDWAVSTGREQLDITSDGRAVSTNTPSGYFELDPHRSYPRYRSSQWNEPMPYSMFFNWVDHGLATGLAIHGADDEHAEELGTRASAGCVRLALENAKILFDLVRGSFKGPVPEMEYDEQTATTMSNGALAHDPDGNLRFSEGYRVLVLIDEYGGSEDLQASLF